MSQTRGQTTSSRRDKVSATAKALTPTITHRFPRDVNGKNSGCAKITIYNRVSTSYEVVGAGWGGSFHRSCAIHCCSCSLDGILTRSEAPGSGWRTLLSV